MFHRLRFTRSIPATCVLFFLTASAHAQTLKSGTLSLVATLADGRSCHAAGTISDLPLTRSGAVSSIVRSSDCTEFDQVYAEVDGDQLITRDYEACTNVQVRAVR